MAGDAKPEGAKPEDKKRKRKRKTKNGDDGDDAEKPKAKPKNTEKLSRGRLAAYGF